MFMYGKSIFILNLTFMIFLISTQQTEKQSNRQDSKDKSLKRNNPSRKMTNEKESSGNNLIFNFIFIDLG